jgi:prophage antirepressor-like protein
MTHKLKLFDFYDHVLRVFPDENGEAWFIAKDVAEILEYSDAHKMTQKLDDDEVQNRQIGGFGNRGVNLINESGLYSAILSSQKPQAKKFKRWVTHEVLPSIRKTGNYTVTDSKQHTTSVNKALNMLPGAMRAARELGLNPSWLF